MQFRKTIVWLRRDLRLEDNIALSKACEMSENVLPLFVFDSNILSKIKNKEDRRVQFIYETLLQLKEDLNNKGKDILILYGKPEVEIPKIAINLNVDALFCNKDYENYAYTRDHSVKKQLQAHNIQFFAFKDQVIFEEKEILNKQAQPYQVFTPYKRAWLAMYQREKIKEAKYKIDKLFSLQSLNGFNSTLSLTDIGFKAIHLQFKIGRAGGIECLQNFATKLSHYHETRDLFAVEGTSRLSVHLRFGTLSIRELFHFAEKNHSQGSDIWQAELIWREFYKMILCQFPYVEEQCFKQQCVNIQWHDNPEYFEKWKNGMTGFPIIDAAMRQFNQTGWMHNRLRMIVASFLTKDLLLDYRKGEEYFADNLIDFDLSSNNGGWQWCASTGCDAQPYFRVFNPAAQSKKFDPSGAFIRKYCPELKLLDDRYIHEPINSPEKVLTSAQCRLGIDYPKPIVQHDIQRLKAMNLFH
ncbi:cryptochrome/photolyase family protein [Fluviispira sanaruensis]|uniref:Deoxyribodipyrimidine photo-lyase n=1 Tax=Fluviispira sanaruensis TaxID=2493639 RepID=A0A4P2VJH3_FLUSA|nr:deoxyribodipyrimidine photo-lyase [Fluviispira sanaruensis]BBH52851.1 deoxyribodipyrimidine photo-lyase [Fluviispira sanaruensis]